MNTDSHIFQGCSFKASKMGQSSSNTNTGSSASGIEPPPTMVPVIFRWKKENTFPSKVSITGSFDNWQKQMVLHNSRGNFYTIQMLPEGTYEYKFIVDGVWQYDEKKKMVDDSFGSFNNVLEVTKTDLKVFETLAKDIDCTEHEMLIDNCGFTLEEYGECGYSHDVWSGTGPREMQTHPFSPHLYVEMLSRLNAGIHHDPAFYQESSLMECADNAELLQILIDIINSTGPKMSAPKDSPTEAKSIETIEKSPTSDTPNTTESGATPKSALTKSLVKVESGKFPDKSVISITPTEAESGEPLQKSPTATRFGKMPQNADSCDSSKDAEISEIQQDSALGASSKKPECGAIPKSAQSDSSVKTEVHATPTTSTGSDPFTGANADSKEVKIFYKNYDPNMPPKLIPELNHLHAKPITVKEPMYTMTSTQGYRSKTIVQVCYQDVDPRFECPSRYFKERNNKKSEN